MMRSGFFAALVVVLLPGAAATAGDMLADRHSVRGVGCAECHGKSSPQNAVTSAPCMACHGTLTAMAAQPAAAGRANPHIAGGRASDCFDCHRAHAAR